MSETYPTNGALHREDQRLQGGLREAGAQTAMLRREVEDLQRQLDTFKLHVGANLSSLNDLAAELTAEVASLAGKDEDPSFVEVTVGTLRALTFNLGWQFRGEHPPGDWDPEAEYARLAGETEADKPLRKLEECWGPDEPDEPEIPDWNPGDEVDDQGGASEYPYLTTPEDRA